jgi:hypothetical protein
MQDHSGHYVKGHFVILAQPEPKLNFDDKYHKYQQGLSLQRIIQMKLTGART